MNRLTEIDRAKALMIVLVVAGHMFGKAPPVGGEWWFVPVSWIYSFHMPVFMFLSGFVFFLRGYPDRALENFPKFAAGRAYRLLLPFVLMGLVILAGKLIASRFVFVDNNPEGLTSGLLGILNIGPPTIMFIWFLYVLFIFSVATPWVYRLLGRNIYLLLGLGLFLFFLPQVYTLYADRITKTYIFFVLGGLCALKVDMWRIFVTKGLWAFVAAFTALTVAFFILNWNTQVLVASNTWNLAFSLTAIPMTIGLFCLPHDRAFAVFDWLAPYVTAVYLFNVIFIGVAKAAMAKLVPFDAAHMAWFIPVLMTAGLIGPILLKFLILKRWKVSDELTS